jgi:hypothetical protein
VAARRREGTATVTWWTGADQVHRRASGPAGPFRSASVHQLGTASGGWPGGVQNGVGGGLPLEPLWSRRTGGLSVTFVRAVDLPFAACGPALADWWRRDAAGTALRLGRGRLTGPPMPAPQRDGAGWRVPVVLVPGFGCPARPMTLEVLPWFETFGTKLALQPSRAVRGSRRYFAAGHDLLDRVIEGIACRAGTGPARSPTVP